MKIITLLFCFCSSILFAQKLPEKEISAAALDYILQRESICKYIQSYKEGNRTLHIFSSRKEPKNTNAVYIDGTKIIWRVENDITGVHKGRWRTDASEEVLTFTIQGDKLILLVKFSDNSTDSKIYSIKKLQVSIK